MVKNKNSSQNIVKGAMILAVSVFITKLISIVYRIPVTNALGDIGNGIYSVAYQVYILIITLTSIGLPSAISKLVSERTAVGDYKEAHRVYKIAMSYSVSLAIILSALLWFGADAAADFFNMPEAAWPIRALVPAVIIVTIMAVMKGYFQGLQSMSPTAVSQVVEQIVHAVVSIALAYGLLRFGLEAAVVGSTLGVAVGTLFGLLTLIFIYYLIRPTIKKRIHKSKSSEHDSNGEILKKILITSIPIMLSASVFSIMTTIDYRMMSSILPDTIEKIRAMGNIAQLPVAADVLHDNKLITDSLVGIFSFKYMTILNLPVSLILTLGMAATPAVAASMAQRDFKDVRKKIRMVLKIGMLFAAPAAIGLTVFGKQVIMFLLPGEPYGGELLAYGAIAIIFITIAQLTSGILQGMGKQHIPTVNALVACGIKVILNLILLPIPIFNVYAVIHSTTICYMIFAALNVFYLLRVIKMKLHAKAIILKPIGIAIVMGIVAKLIYTILYSFKPYNSLWLVLSILIAMIVYGVLGVVTRTITDEDLESIPGGRKISRLLHRTEEIQ